MSIHIEQGHYPSDTGSCEPYVTYLAPNHAVCIAGITLDTRVSLTLWDCECNTCLVLQDDFTALFDDGNHPHKFSPRSFDVV